MAALHPRDALFRGERPFPALAPCEHYAGSEKLIQKSLQLQSERGGAFDVTLDLEDGAEEGREDEHARMVVELLQSASAASGSARTRGGVGVRIHPHQHPRWHADVDTVVRGAGPKIAYLTVPKTDSAARLREVIAYIRAVEQDTWLGRAIPIHALIETHGALREVFEIAAIASLEVLDFGLMDFISDHHGAIPESCMRSPGQFEHALLRRAKSEIVAAALGRGLVPSHNVTLDLRNPDQARQDALRARRELGFLRMWSVHPAQIDPIIESMRPEALQIARASEVLLRAQQKSWAPIELEGQLLDRASYRYHWQVLERAHRAGAEVPEDALRAFFGGG